MTKKLLDDAKDLLKELLDAPGIQAELRQIARETGRPVKEIKRRLRKSRPKVEQS